MNFILKGKCQQQPSHHANKSCAQPFNHKVLALRLITRGSWGAAAEPCWETMGFPTSPLDTKGQWGKSTAETWAWCPTAHYHEWQQSPPSAVPLCQGDTLRQSSAWKGQEYHPRHHLSTAGREEEDLAPDMKLCRQHGVWGCLSSLWVGREMMPDCGWACLDPSSGYLW